MPKYGCKIDANHAEIVQALKEIGASLVDTSKLGGGFPDLIVGYHGVTLLMEIKNPKTQYGRRGLNQNQKTWKDSWTGGPYVVVTDIEGAIRAARAMAKELSKGDTCKPNKS